MAKRRTTKRAVAKRSTVANKGWAGFTPFQLIVVFSVFIVFAIYFMM